ncbi:MAG: ferritin-like domain-containing protein [Gemmatimonadaceae bacterium]
MSASHAISTEDKLNDIKILNRALFFEHRAVWAYRTAADKLSSSDVGRAVRALASENQSDHEKHQDLLRNAIDSLSGIPIQMESNYDLSSYIKKGYGNLDNDVNIAKLALALEVGAAAGYVTDTTQLRSPAMIEMEAGIACVEAIHAARIRVAFNQLGIKVPVVPNVVLNASSRQNWVFEV